MKKRAWLLGVACVAGVLSACEDEPTELPWPLPVVTSSSASYTTSGVSFTITNPGDGDVIFVDRCSGDLQRRTPDTWELVVARACSRDPAQNRLTVKVLPGEQLVETSFANAVLEPGQYRAVFYVSTDTTAFLRQAVVSNTFVVMPTGS